MTLQEGDLPLTSGGVKVWGYEVPCGWIVLCLVLVACRNEVTTRSPRHEVPVPSHRLLPFTLFL